MGDTTRPTTTAIPKKQCATCNKSGGVMICDGCEKAFCAKHVIEHRQQLGVELGRIIQEYDLLQEKIEKPLSNKSSSLEEIDKWEKETIAKIQQAAATARNNLETLEKQNRERLKKSSTDISSILRASLEADDFSELELREWLNQLKDFQSELSTPSTVKVVLAKRPTLRLIAVEENEPVTNPPSNEKPAASASSTTEAIKQSPTIDSKATNKTSNPPNNKKETSKKAAPSQTAKPKELFLELMGPIATSEASTICTHTGISDHDAYTRGSLAYSAGCHMIRFQIVRCQKTYYTFFGCMSSKEKLKTDAFRCPQTVGWFGSNQVYEHGRCSSNSAKYGYNSTKFQENDIMQLILDCDRREIRLFNERLKHTCTLKVNVSSAPLPWQFLVVLRHSGDSVRILSESW